MTTYNWTRRKVCDVCQQPFSTNGGNLTACAVCRHKPEYVQKRKERAARLHKEWLAREASRKRRGEPAHRSKSQPGEKVNAA